MRFSVVVFALFHVYASYTEVWFMDGVGNVTAVLSKCGGVGGNHLYSEIFSKNGTAFCDNGCLDIFISHLAETRKTRIIIKVFQENFGF